ncbi:MAG: DUF3048 domain-containing protein [Ilumatobacter sp.]|nr:DUF3048 domain-containing protein [Ilumatobacter sp.]
MTIPKSAVALAATTLFVASCSGGGEATITEPSTTTAPPTTIPPPTTSTTTTSTSTTSTTVPVTTTTLPAVIRQPLTGEPLDDESGIIQRPALAVKIDNHRDSRRNHTGLAVADIVFEEKVEGGLTRFAAVFHSRDADPIGPIRSGRSQDVALLSSMNRPLFAWSGGNAGVTRLIRDSFLTDLNWQRNSGSYYRGSGGAPHNLYSNSEALYRLTPDDHPGPPTTQFAYLRDGEVFAGEPATEVDLRIGDIDIEWNWNADSGRYERSQEGSRHNDSTYGGIDADNIVVLVVDYRPSQIDSRSPEAQTIGDGPVYVFSNGQVVTGRWSRELEVFATNLVDDAGQPIALSPGQTWIELAEAIPSGDEANPDVNLLFS